MVGDVLRRQTTEGQSIEIYNLRKVFGQKIAVDGLSLSMYSGQITALLGHNGAGKTTTIAMLTGAVAPTDGYATITGKDIRSDMSSIRQDIGICLQHDCLFPILTVKEHLQFFARVKGLYNRVAYNEAEEQIDQAIRDVALFEKRNTYAKSLSGGMKRKLSVAVAFSGGSKVVFLDEPTSGMDPFSRRFTWNVIRQYRQDRCIILTTHFMDEADILGDRIAIMAEGQLRCVGSSLFLKKTYGVGYQLTVEKKHSTTSSTPSTPATPESASPPRKSRIQDEPNLDDIEVQASSSTVDVPRNIDERLNKIVLKIVPDSSLLNNTGTEVRYQLPMESSSTFPLMFEGLDQECDRESIQSYGVSMTTLDEVFLVVARGDQVNSTSTSTKPLTSSTIISQNETEDDDGDFSRTSRSDRSSKKIRMDLEQEGTLFLRHVGALTRKRLANFSRDKKAWCCTTLAPTFCVLLGLIFVTFTAPNRNLEPITLSLDDLNKDVTEQPVNPILYNSPNSAFVCQPGQCSYIPPVLQINETDEFYGYCGFLSRSFDPVNPTWTNNKSCSLALSADIMSTLEYAQEMNAGSVYESSKALYATSDVFQASQYGAILFTHDSSSIVVETWNNFSDKATSNCQFNSQLVDYSDPDNCIDRYGGLGYVLQYNFTALHITPLLQALADQAIIRYATNNNLFQIVATIAPFPITAFEEGLGEAQDAFLLFILVVLGFPIVAGAFGAFIVAERESKAKHLQTVAGVHPVAYWLSTFLWDTLNYQIPLWITIALFFLFDMTALTTIERDIFPGIVLLLFLYGPAAAAFTYCLTFAFTSPSLCSMVSIISGFLIGMGGPIALFIMEIITADPEDDSNLRTVINVLTWVLRFHPSFCLGKGVFYVLNITFFVYIENNPELTAFNERVLGYDVLFLAIQIVVYMLLTIQLDTWCTNPAAMSIWKKFVNIITCNWRAGSDDKYNMETVTDPDVGREEERVLSGGANGDLIVLSQLTKIYDNGKRAVNNVSLGIPHGQCFGLLGINGAGKTTTMAMLTAEFPPSSGDATLAGFSVSREPEKTRRRIGYCPQFDAHFVNMTGREHIEMYASIKGVPRDAVKEAAAAKLSEVGLSEFDGDRLCSNYSGGMRRRLSLAIATIGSPQIVFLDECSTGVDPVARREIWELISAMVSDDSIPKNERTSVILTTHSMEECEALCPRIGIMANGRLRCLGSAQHLKNKFGQGYQIELKTALVREGDTDYIGIVEALANSKDVEPDQVDTITLTLTEVYSELQKLTDDNYLTGMVTSDNAIGYSIWRDAQAPTGISLGALAGFATSELRLRNIEIFLQTNFTGVILRERQDLKVRYEVSSVKTRISDIFTKLETNKGRLCLDDYGVSQTSLEQVFNMHAAEAEKIKQGQNDG